MTSGMSSSPLTRQPLNLRIACLQFSPALGETAVNISRADAILEKACINPGQIDLLVLPELAFTGYNFSSLEAITPFLEPTTAGVSTEWAKTTAVRLQCTVLIGYPESAAEGTFTRVEHDVVTAVDDSVPHGRPIEPQTGSGFPYNYNALVMVDREGVVIGNYRKSHLYYTDATWAREGSGFFSGSLVLGAQQETIATTMGICMDINNKNFTAPWTDYEYATNVLHTQSRLAVVSMAWLTSPPGDVVEVVEKGTELQPRVETVGYWLERFKPLVNAEHKTVIVTANRTGTEGNVLYAGSSAVMLLGHGETKIFDLLGRAEEGLLVVETSQVRRKCRI